MVRTSASTLVSNNTALITQELMKRKINVPHQIRMCHISQETRKD